MITPATSTSSLLSLSAAENGSDPVISSLSNGNTIAVWWEPAVTGPGSPNDDDGGIYARVFDPDGQPVGDPVLVNQNPVGLQNLPRVTALEDGGFAVCWTDNKLISPQDGIDSDIMMRVFDNDAVALTDETEVSIDDPIPNSVEDDNSDSDIFALQDGGFVVTYTIGNGYEIEAQQYDATGAAVGGPVQIFAQTQFPPAGTQLANGDIVYVTDVTDDVVNGYTMRVSGATLTSAPSGIPGAGGPVVLERGVYGDYRPMTIAALSDGGFVTATAYYDNSANPFFRLAIYDSSYEEVTTFDIPRDDDVSGIDRYAYDLIGLEEGGFLLVYTAPDSDQDGQFGRLFKNDGTAVGDETLLLPNQTGAQVDAEYVQTGPGEITVVYNDYSKLLSPQFLVSARFTVDGTAEQSIEIIGTPDPDTLIGTEGNDTINGLASNDILQGKGGDDVLLGDGLDVGSTPVAGQVYRLFRATLDREPGTPGLLGWTAQVIEGTSTLEEVTSGFVNSLEFQTTYGSTTNTEFVTLLYQNVLDREPDSGLNAWVNALDTNTLTREQVTLSFSESTEFQNTSAVAARAFIEARSESVWADDVYRLYQATLGREPDSGGFANWTSNLSNGGNFLNVVSGFVNSTEFQNTYGTTTDDE
ncbi:MAG: DUF4214 domain-containing protein, partial [Pseudooceanicola sp.]